MSKSKKGNMSTATAKKKHTANPPTPSTVLQTVTLPPSAIDVNVEHKGRIVPVSEDAVKALAVSMSENGQLQPVQCYPLENGTPRLMFGFTRHRAAQLIVNGFSVSGEHESSPEKVYPPNEGFQLRCEILDKPSDDDILIRTLTENAQRSGTSKIDDAVNQQLLRDAGMTDLAISRIYGYASSASVMRLRELLKLSPEWQARIADETVTMQAGNLIAAWSDDHAAQNRLWAMGIVADPGIMDRMGQKGAEWLLANYGKEALPVPDEATEAPGKPAATPAAGETAPAAPAVNETPVKARAATAKEIKDALTSAADPAAFAGTTDDQTAGVIIAVLTATKTFAEGGVSFAAYMDSLKALCG